MTIMQAAVVKEFGEDLIIEPQASGGLQVKGGAFPAEEWEIQPLDKVIANYVAAAVKAAGGNVRKAARQLQISPSTLYARLKDAEDQPVK